MCLCSGKHFHCWRENIVLSLGFSHINNVSVSLPQASELRTLHQCCPWLPSHFSRFWLCHWKLTLLDVPFWDWHNTLSTKLSVVLIIELLTHMWGVLACKGTPFTCRCLLLLEAFVVFYCCMLHIFSCYAIMHSIPNLIIHFTLSLVHALLSDRFYDAQCYVDNGFDNITNVIYNIAGVLNRRKFGGWLDSNKSFGSSATYGICKKNVFWYKILQNEFDQYLQAMRQVR